MKRKLLLLTDGEVGTIRAALRTMAGESGVPTGPIDKMMDKLNAAPVITKAQWKRYETAAGELLEAGPDAGAEHLGGDRGMSMCYRFQEKMNTAFQL